MKTNNKKVIITESDLRSIISLVMAERLKSNNILRESAGGARGAKSLFRTLGLVTDPNAYGRWRATLAAARGWDVEKVNKILQFLEWVWAPGSNVYRNWLARSDWFLKQVDDQFKVIDAFRNSKNKNLANTLTPTVKNTWRTADADVIKRVDSKSVKGGPYEIEVTGTAGSRPTWRSVPKNVETVLVNGEYIIIPQNLPGRRWVKVVKNADGTEEVTRVFGRGPDELTIGEWESALGFDTKDIELGKLNIDELGKIPAKARAAMMATYVGGLVTSGFLTSYVVANPIFGFADEIYDMFDKETSLDLMFSSTLFRELQTLKAVINQDIDEDANFSVGGGTWYFEKSGQVPKITPGFVSIDRAFKLMATAARRLTNWSKLGPGLIENFRVMKKLSGEADSLWASELESMTDQEIVDLLNDTGVLYSRYGKVWDKTVTVQGALINDVEDVDELSMLKEAWILAAEVEDKTLADFSYACSRAEIALKSDTSLRQIMRDLFGEGFGTDGYGIIDTFDGGFSSATIALISVATEKAKKSANAQIKDAGARLAASREANEKERMEVDSSIASDVVSLANMEDVLRKIHRDIKAMDTSRLWTNLDSTPLLKNENQTRETIAKILDEASEGSLDLQALSIAFGDVSLDPGGGAAAGSGSPSPGATPETRGEPATKSLSVKVGEITLTNEMEGKNIDDFIKATWVANGGTGHPFDKITGAIIGAAKTDWIPRLIGSVTAANDSYNPFTVDEFANQAVDVDKENKSKWLMKYIVTPAMVAIISGMSATEYANETKNLKTDDMFNWMRSKLQKATDK